MITRIREVRRAKQLTLEQVAAGCRPPTTPQTIGRLETGARTVSVAWLNRIAASLGVAAEDLLLQSERISLPLVAMVDHQGVHASKQDSVAVAPEPRPDMVALKFAASLGEYRSGDELWCSKVQSGDFGLALNRDLLVPRPGGRFLFGRLIGRGDGRLQILPLASGSRQIVIEDPEWAAVARTLIRTL